MYQYKDRDTATCNRIECPKKNSHIHRSVDFQQRCQIHSTEKGGTFQKWCWKNDDGGLVTKFCPTLVTPWTVARQAPLSMGFYWQENGTAGCHFLLWLISPPRGRTCVSCMAGRFFTAGHWGGPTDNTFFS